LIPVGVDHEEDLEIGGDQEQDRREGDPDQAPDRDVGVAILNLRPRLQTAGRVVEAELRIFRLPLPKGRIRENVVLRFRIHESMLFLCPWSGFSTLKIQLWVVTIWNPHGTWT
jgi:hypothetical protein